MKSNVKVVTAMGPKDQTSHLKDTSGNQFGLMAPQYRESNRNNHKGFDST